MFKLMDRVPDEGIAPMLDDLEAHIYDNGIGKRHFHLARTLYMKLAKPSDT